MKNTSELENKAEPVRHNDMRDLEKATVDGKKAKADADKLPKGTGGFGFDANKSHHQD